MATVLWMVKPTLEASEDWDWEYRTQLTTTEVSRVPFGVITAPLNSDFLIFVDDDYNLRWIGADGRDETVINDDGDWSSIALSLDGSRMMATTNYDEPVIYYFDLVQPENNRLIELYHPTTQDGIHQDIARFAMSMQWDATGTYVIYDVYNSLPGPSGEMIDFYSVNALDPTSGAIWPIFPPQPEGVHIFSPSLSSAIRPDGTIDDCRLLYVRANELNARAEIRVLDWCTGEEGVLYTLHGDWPFPGFINGDREIVFDRLAFEDDDLTYHLVRLPLADDGFFITG